MSSTPRRAARGKSPRGTGTRRPTRRRAPWFALLALAAAYACLLGISPVGQAGLLWLHLSAEHGGSAPHAAAEHRHDGGTAHRHAAADPDRGPDSGPGHESDGDAGRPVAPNAPHEHHGRLHTHDRSPVEDPTVPVDALSKYYLPADPTAPRPPARDPAVAPAAAPAPSPTAPRIDTPPPRRPG